MIKQHTAFFLLLLLGFVIRLQTAANTFLYKDEVLDFEIARASSFKDLFLYKYWDIFHPPLYFIVLKLWTFIGTGPLFLRIPSVFASGIVFVEVFVLGKLLLPASKTFSFIVLSLFIFSHTQNSIGVMVRQYGFEIMFMMLSLILFYRSVAGKKNNIFFVVLVYLLVFFGDYSGFWLIGSYYLFIISAYFFNIISKKQTIDLLRPIFIATFIFSIWAVFFLIKELPKAFSVVNNGFFGDERFFINAIIYNSPFFSGSTAYDVPVLWKLLSLHWWSLMLLFISFIGLTLFLYRDKEKGLLPFYLFTAPLFISLIFSVFFYKIFVNRNLIVISIATLVGLAYFIEYLITRKQVLVRILGIFFMTILIINFLNGFPKLHYVEQYNWVVLAKTLREKSAGSKINIITPNPKFLLKPLAYYGNILSPPIAVAVKTYRNTKESDFSSGSIFVVRFTKEYSPHDKKLTPEALQTIEFLYQCTMEEIGEIIPSVEASYCKTNN